MEETREMEQEIQQESDSFDTGLLERMNRIYEEREREYQKFYDQIRSREEELERIGTTLAVQKEEQEKKEAHLQEFEQSLKVIQERLEQRTDQLKQEEEALEQLTAEQRDQLEKEYQKLKQSKANAEIKQQIEINELRNQRIVLEREKGEVAGDEAEAFVWRTGRRGYKNPAAGKTAGGKCRTDRTAPENDRSKRTGTFRAGKP